MFWDVAEYTMATCCDHLAVQTVPFGTGSLYGLKWSPQFQTTMPSAACSGNSFGHGSKIPEQSFGPDIQLWLEQAPGLQLSLRSSTQVPLVSPRTRCK